MKLREIAPADAEFDARRGDIKVSGVATDSRSVKHGDVFVAIVGGKTGTADKVVNGRYSKAKVLTDFMAVLPADQPRYLLLIMLDEPHATPETHGFTTSGWNAVPTGGAVVARIAPLLGIEPRPGLPGADQLILASVKESR